MKTNKKIEIQESQPSVNTGNSCRTSSKMIYYICYRLNSL